MLKEVNEIKHLLSFPDLPLLRLTVSRLVGNTLQCNVQHWLSPPDPSTNHTINSEDLIDSNATARKAVATIAAYMLPGNWWTRGSPVQDRSGCRQIGTGLMACYPSLYAYRTTELSCFQLYSLWCHGMNFILFTLQHWGMAASIPFLAHQNTKAYSTVSPCLRHRRELASARPTATPQRTSACTSNCTSVSRI
jgi:hypothetical protein